MLLMRWGVKMNLFLLVFPSFNRGEGCVTPVVPLVPGSYDCAVDIHMYA